MDRLTKFLNKLDAKLAAKIIQVIEQIGSDQLENLDILPMKGHKNCFRCRVGSIRIIFIRSSGGINSIVEVDFRGNIYKKQ